MEVSVLPRSLWNQRVARRAGIAGALCLGSIATPAFAEQFILFDATFTYTWDDANNSSPSKSHYYVNDENGMNTERPANWVSPINYRDGSVHIRIEVTDKPAGGQTVGWALCYDANVGSYGCPYTDYYTETGVYDKDVDMNGFWKDGPITWESGIEKMDLVYTINNSGSGHVHNFPDLASATTPTTVRITMVQVSEGDTYDPSILDLDDGTGGTAAGGSNATGGAATGGDFAAAGGSDGVVAAGGTAATGGAVGADGGENPGSGPTDDGTGDGDSTPQAVCSLNGRIPQEPASPLTLLFLGGLAWLGYRRTQGKRRVA